MVLIRNHRPDTSSTVRGFFCFTMKYTSLIDNVKSLEWGLSIQEAYLFSWVYSLPSWADKVIIGTDVFYFGSKTKAIEDYPLLTDKPDTVYRYYKSLEQKGLILIKKIDGKDYLALTEKSKTWGSKSEQSENNPRLLGKKSDLNSEKNPTYTINSFISKLDDTDLKEISKEILPSDLENEKLRLEVERLNQALEEKNKKDSTKGGAGKPKKVSWLDLKEMELPEFYNDEEFRETWQSWCDFKHSRKETLTEKGIELWFKKLETLSSRDMATSIQIVNESIANNWQGIFELKNQKSNAKPISQKPSTPYGAVGGVNAQGRGMFFAPIYDTAESSTSDDRHEVEGFYQSEL